ncbi:MAG: glycine zipper 2TM domain-containing protein [Pseudomonadota bacterium]
MKCSIALFAGIAVMIPAYALADTCHNCTIYYEPGKREIHYEGNRYVDVDRNGYKRWKKWHRKQARYAHSHKVRRARVISVEPVYRYYTQSHGYDSCLNRDHNPSGYRSWTPTVLGAVIGGAVGHRIGDAHGDANAAAIAGGVLGAAIGRDVSHHNRESRHLSVSGPCYDRKHQKVNREPVEYVVSYRYNGSVYSTRMDYHPGEWVELDADRRY